MKQISSAGWLCVKPRLDRIRREAYTIYLDATKAYNGSNQKPKKDTLALENLELWQTKSK